ncbi:MAG: glycosyltransferase, partial [Nitrospirae bacterium]|nr:glycosyltransferase [Nitrospirota bacterium]
TEKFDYILLINIIGYVDDVQEAFGQLQKVCKNETRIIIVYFNYLWEPILKAAESFSFREKHPVQHWLPIEDIENILNLCDFESVKKDYRFLVPVNLSLISWFCNRFIVKLPFFRMLALNAVIIARPAQTKIEHQEVSCSIVIPCRNERGNIEDAVRRIKNMGRHTEIIFIEGHSKDGTLQECYRVQREYDALDIKVFVQDGIGKGNAVRKGFDESTGDVLMILDADLTVSPESLPKFFNTLLLGKGELIMGNRLTYQMEKMAMRKLNLIGNKFFSLMFSFLLEQRIRDTLCGTKVLMKKDIRKFPQIDSILAISIHLAISI